MENKNYIKKIIDISSCQIEDNINNKHFIFKDTIKAMFEVNNNNSTANFIIKKLYLSKKELQEDLDNGFIKE